MLTNLCCLLTDLCISVIDIFLEVCLTCLKSLDLLRLFDEVYLCLTVKMFNSLHELSLFILPLLYFLKTLLLKLFLFFILFFNLMLELNHICKVFVRKLLYLDQM